MSPKKALSRIIKPLSISKSGIWKSSILDCLISSIVEKNYFYRIYRHFWRYGYTTWKQKQTGPSRALKYSWKSPRGHRILSSLLCNVYLGPALAPCGGRTVKSFFNCNSRTVFLLTLYNENLTVSWRQLFKMPSCPHPTLIWVPDLKLYSCTLALCSHSTIESTKKKLLLFFVNVLKKQYLI